MNIEKSLQIYTIMILLSTFFLWCADTLTNNEDYDNNLFRQRILNLPYMIFAILSFIAPFFISAFRLNVGTDYMSYVLMAKNPINYVGIPVFFKNLLIILLHFNLTDLGFFIFSSFLILFTYFLVIIILSESPHLSLFMFFIMEDFFVSMNIVRQYIAMGILLVAYLLYREHYFYVGIAFNIIGIMIHPSVIIFNVFLIILFAFRKFNFTRFNTTMLIIFSPILLLFVPLFKVILRYTAFGKFLDNSYSLFHYRWTFLMILVYFICLVLIVIFANFARVQVDYGAKSFLLANLCIILLLVGSYFISGNAYRVIYLLTPIMIIYYPRVLMTIENKELRLVVNICIICCFIVTTIIMITHNNNDVIPYYNQFITKY